MTWSRRFDAPIALPAGGKITTLRQAGEYVAALPAAEQNEPRWRTATECLISAAERGGIVMLAEIAMRKALTSAAATRS
jgi:glycerol-3-phosphate dehydrogenase